MRYVFIFLLAFALCSCSDSESIETVNLKDYFWKISDHQEPKVYQYELDSLGHKSLSFYHVQAIDSQRLLIKLYNSKYELTAELTDIISDSNIVIEKWITPDSENKSKFRNAIIQESQIFSFNNQNRECYYRIKMSGTKPSYWTLDKHAYWSLDELSTTNTPNKPIPTIISKGKELNMAIYNGRGDTINGITETHYMKNIGMSLAKISFDFGDVIQTFQKIKPLAEFEADKDKMDIQRKMGFGESLDIYVLTSKYVLEDKKDITYISHDSEDGSWQFLSDDTIENYEADARVISLGQVIGIDSSVIEAAGLRLGSYLTRANKDSSWMAFGEFQFR